MQGSGFFKVSRGLFFISPLPVDPGQEEVEAVVFRPERSPLLQKLFRPVEIAKIDITGRQVIVSQKIFRIELQGLPEIINGGL